MARLPRLLNRPPVRWQAAARRLSITETQRLIDELDAIAIRAARLSGYLTSYKLLGANHPHEAGVQRANRNARHVRKALGFAYPADDLSF